MQHASLLQKAEQRLHEVLSAPLAECNDYHPNFDVEIENQFVEQYTELFSKIAYLS